MRSIPDLGVEGSLVGSTMPAGYNVLGWTIVEGVERDEALILIQLVNHYNGWMVLLP